MKVLKISLVVIVVAAIVFIAILSTRDGPKPVGQISMPDNQFTKRIEVKIDSLSHMPVNEFCKDLFFEITSEIDSYYKGNRLGFNPKTQNYDSLANEMRNSNYTSLLYVVYSEKFISQAFYVFTGSEWNVEDLNFIRREYQALKRFDLFIIGSTVDNKFTEIQTIFRRYDEINSFITSCKNFTFLSTGLSSRFPIDDVKGKLSQARIYQNNQGYVNNCKRMQESLREIPQILLTAHERYFENKINFWSNKFGPPFNSQADYVNNLYNPLRDEIATFSNSIYNVANFDSKYLKLKQRWSDDNNDAYRYWSQRRSGNIN